MSDPNEKTGDAGTETGDGTGTSNTDAADLPDTNGISTGAPPSEPTAAPADGSKAPTGSWKPAEVDEAGRTRPMGDALDGAPTVIKTAVKPEDKDNGEGEQPDPKTETKADEPTPALRVPPRKPAQREPSSNAAWWIIGIAALILLTVGAINWMAGNGNQPAPVVVIDPDSHLVLDYVHQAGQDDHRGELFASADGKRFIRCREIDHDSNGNPAPVRDSCVHGVAGR